MKHFFSILTVFAILNFSFAKFSIAGEVAKKPLKLEEMIVLAEEEAQDFETTRDTEAGIKDGYGMLALLLAGVVAWAIIDQANND